MQVGFANDVYTVYLLFYFFNCTMWVNKEYGLWEGGCHIPYVC